MKNTPAIYLELKGKYLKLFDEYAASTDDDERIDIVNEATDIAFRNFNRFL